MSQNFCDELYSSVRNFRDALPDDAQIKQRGFSIFFAPPKPGRLLLVGLNPSRSDASYSQNHPESERGAPAMHLYLNERGGKLSRELHGMLLEVDAENSEISVDNVWQKITSGTKINLYFFGSRNWTEWSSDQFWGVGGRELKKRVESKCVAWTRQVISELSPSKIICEGFSSFEQLCNLYGRADQRTKIVTRSGRGKQRLYEQSSILVEGSETPVLGILHPTGGWGRTKEETRLLGEAIVKFVASK